jgi:malate/lactate dehydrogenase
MKIAIVGAGSVGTAIAYATAIQGVADEIALYDLNGAKATAEILDLQHGLQFVPSVQVQGGDELDACRDADIVVITAGAKQKPGQSRLDLAGANATITREIVPQLLALAPDAVLLFVTNPVDVVTFVARSRRVRSGSITIASSGPAPCSTRHGCGTGWRRPCRSPCRACMRRSSGSTATVRSRCGRRPTWAERR